jgi:hypothetical protein
MYSLVWLILWDPCLCTLLGIWELTCLGAFMTIFRSRGTHTHCKKFTKLPHQEVGENIQYSCSS